MRSRKFAPVLLPFPASPKPLRSGERSPAPRGGGQGEGLGREPAGSGDFAAEQASATGVTPAVGLSLPI